MLRRLHSPFDHLSRKTAPLPCHYVLSRRLGWSFRHPRRQCNQNKKYSWLHQELCGRIRQGRNCHWTSSAGFGPASRLLRKKAVIHLEQIKQGQATAKECWWNARCSLSSKLLLVAYSQRRSKNATRGKYMTRSDGIKSRWTWLLPLERI